MLSAHDSFGFVLIFRLLFPRQRIFWRCIAQAGQDPLRVVTAQKVHAGTVKRFGITFPLPGKRFIQRICIRPARQKIAYRIAKRVVHDAVQLVPENKLSQPASRNLV